MKLLLQFNSGDNTFSTFSEEFHEKDIPLPIGEKTHLMLTHPNHTISQIEKSFISMEIEFEVGFKKEIKWEDWYIKNTEDPFNLQITARDIYHLCQIFVGFKDAIEIISEARFYCDGKLINEYYQNEMIRESFAYNSIRNRDAKITCPHSHSTWENVNIMSPNVCGCYIPVQDLVWTEDHKQTWKKITMELIIPFTDQLVLQAWRLYPNIIIGDIVEEIRTSLDGLVWSQVPPSNVGELKRFWENNETIFYFQPNVILPKRFYQIGQVGRIVGNFADYVKNQIPRFQNTIMNNALVVNQKVKPMIKKGRTNCFGFGIKPECVEELMEIFSEEIYDQAQELTRYIFEQKHTEKGIVCSKIVPLRNATNITMMFPR